MIKIELNEKNYEIHPSALSKINIEKTNHNPTQVANYNPIEAEEYFYKHSKEDELKLRAYLLAEKDNFSKSQLDYWMMAKNEVLMEFIRLEGLYNYKYLSAMN